MNRSRSAGQYTHVRLFRPAVLVVGGGLAAAALFAALAGLGKLVEAAVAGHTNWGMIAMSAAVLMMIGGVLLMLVRVHRADLRLEMCPDPRPGDVVLARMRPRVRFSALLQGVSAIGMIAFAIGVGLDERSWRAEDRLVPTTQLGDEDRQEALERLGAGTVDLDSSPVLRLPAGAAENAAHAGEHWTIAAATLWLASMLAVFCLWLVTNRRRSFLWISAEGMGVLPSWPDDDGYRAWDQVLAVAYVKHTFRFLTSTHVWTVYSVRGPSTTVTMFPGMRKPDAFLAEITRVAPHVEVSAENR